MSSNCCTVRPVNDLKSSGFLDNLSYESKERTRNQRELDHIAVYSNHARDLIYVTFKLFLVLHTIRE